MLVGRGGDELLSWVEIGDGGLTSSSSSSLSKSGGGCLMVNDFFFLDLFFFFFFFKLDNPLLMSFSYKIKSIDSFLLTLESGIGPFSISISFSLLFS